MVKRMSSVLVKGMEMPENCQNCFASDDECRFCRAAKKYIPMLGEPKFCPLVALPDKHGRLVDADADSLKNKLKFINEAEHQIYGRGSWGFTAKCIHAIDDAPTIVEVEDES